MRSAGLRGKLPKRRHKTTTADLTAAVRAEEIRRDFTG